MHNKSCKNKNKGFILVETFLVIIFSLIVAAVAAASVISYRKSADINNQISDARDIVTALEAASVTSSTWLPPGVTNSNVMDILGNMNALPYSIQTQFVPGQKTYTSRLGSSLSANISPTDAKQLSLAFVGVSKDYCSQLADSLMLPGITALTINNTTQKLGPVGNPSSRDPSSSSYSSSCGGTNGSQDTGNSLSFTYSKQPISINTGISDVDFSDPLWVVGSGGNKVAGTGIVSTGAGVIVSGPATSFDRNLYEARIYANNVQASLNVDIIADGSTILHTTDKNTPSGALVGTTKYVQDLGFNPLPTATVANLQTFVVQFNLPKDATSLSLKVTSNNGKPITITKLTIYPVNAYSP